MAQMREGLPTGSNSRKLFIGAACAWRAGARPAARAKPDNPRTARRSSFMIAPSKNRFAVP